MDSSIWLQKKVVLLIVTAMLGGGRLGRFPRGTQAVSGTSCVERRLYLGPRLTRAKSTKQVVPNNHARGKGLFETH